MSIPLYKTDDVRSASGLKITKIEVIALSITLPRDFRGSVYSVPQKNALVTRIHTDHGPIGEA
jgi:D-galactarolactone cycloisomerase